MIQSQQASRKDLERRDLLPLTLNQSTRRFVDYRIVLLSYALLFAVTSGSLRVFIASLSASDCTVFVDPSGIKIVSCQSPVCFSLVKHYFLILFRN